MTFVRFWQSWLIDSVLSQTVLRQKSLKMSKNAQIEKMKTEKSGNAFWGLAAAGNNSLEASMAAIDLGRNVPTRCDQIEQKFVTLGPNRRKLRPL